MTKEPWIEKIKGTKNGEVIAAQGSIPQSEEFFQDHFPDFPTLPGVLMLEILKQTAESYLQSTTVPELSRLRLREVSNVKFTQFLKPGDEWESRLDHMSQKENQIECRGKLSSKERLAASAKLAFEVIPEGESVTRSLGG